MIQQPSTYTAFAGSEIVAAGDLASVLAVVKTWFDRDSGANLLIFEDETGRQVDFDLRGDLETVIERALPTPGKPGPGRPRLGVVSREVSLMPRHWEWLDEQPNGVSAALRRLVDDARKNETQKQRAKRAASAAGRVMTAVAGNLPNYEEASRALYAGDRWRFEELIASWPEGVRTFLSTRAAEAFAPTPSGVL